MWAPQLRSASCLVARVGSASTRVDEKGEARECKLECWMMPSLSAARPLMSSRTYSTRALAQLT